ncbi:hypothetical protein FF38_01400 [Lucilia cuprina]|uniref:Glycosyltransferase family 92 protein n=1 Tax=Lucilia cuprina TaxID=7375 RepID=A0A0L0C9W5_LUCCU|nr:hypothetical protein FF38_01400 [Lucilia cuprina]
MARMSQILKLITVIAFLWLFVILLMNIFNSGHSYHYINVERKLQLQQQHKLHTMQFDNKPKSAGEPKDSKEINLDFNVTEPSITDLVPELQKKLPNLPIEFFYSPHNKTLEKFRNCAQYPPIQMLNFYNTYWQTFHMDGSIFQLYGAYYDERPESGPVVRILAMTNHQQNEFPIIYCQLWFQDDNRPFISTITEYKIIWEPSWGVKPNVYYPYLMTCEVPKNSNVTGDTTPKAVNVVGRQCDTASNSLRVIYEKPAESVEKHDFAVCVKGLDFPYEDLSDRLVEWLEMLNILGVHKVYMHNLQVHANISKVLNYYREKGFVEVQDITLVGGVQQPEIEHWLIKSYPLNKRLNELIPYNSCFYRNMYKYKYIALLDIDEIIMPKDSLKSWQQLLANLQTYEEGKNCPLGFPSLCVANAYFPSKEVPVRSNPSYMYMLNHVYRLKDYTPQRYYVKCLHNTRQIVTLHNHYPFSYLNTDCKPLDIPPAYAQLQHYRKTLSKDDNKEIKDHILVLDESVDRFRRLLLERCKKVLKDLKFIS